MGGDAHLDLVLLPCIFNGLENVPRVPASHFQPGGILSVPALDEQSRLDGCSGRGSVSVLKPLSPTSMVIL